MEVMGLMLGEFVDEYTIRVVDVFAMPQSGTGVSVEAVDPVFQTKMLDMLKQTGRPEMVVGWYHSHPGFGCWLSGVDINTQQQVERFGFVPNGACVYYENRSQPPLLSQMVRAVYTKTRDLTLLKRALPILLKEHAFWTLLLILAFKSNFF